MNVLFSFDPWRVFLRLDEAPNSSIGSRDAKQTAWMQLENGRLDNTGYQAVRGSRSGVCKQREKHDVTRDSVNSKSG